MPSEFISGLRLSGMFYHEAILPVLQSKFSGLRHSAALLGSGSEVLGFDTVMSTDHHWGPRLLIFLNEQDYSQIHNDLHGCLRHELPHSFYGYPTNFTQPNFDDSGVQLLEATYSGPINHRVEIMTMGQFIKDTLGAELDIPLEATDWLTMPSQLLRSVTAGAVYHDDLGLEDFRKQFNFYPRDVWLYLLAAGWKRISQEEAFVGRTGFVGDDLGSQVIAARLVRDIMQLCFLMERQYAPYPKWFGSAFAQLQCAERLTPILGAVIHGESWKEREQSLSQAYKIIATMHNDLHITPPLPTDTWSYFDRPFKVIHGDRFVTAIKEVIADETIRNIPVDIGSVDQFSDSSDLITSANLRQRLKKLYS
ncbi:MAG: DUF4037 domain-containing protein [Anaerolineae bacterium]